MRCDEFESFDSTDTEPHRYADCREPGCTRTARDSDYCDRHTTLAKIIDRLDSVNRQHLLALSIAQTAPTAELAREFTEDAERLSRWARVLVGAGQIARSGLRRRRAPRVGAALFVEVAK